MRTSAATHELWASAFSAGFLRFPISDTYSQSPIVNTVAERKKKKMERIDLSTNSRSIKEAYEKVVQGDKATYVVFSVNKNSTLEVSNVALGSLQDFIEEFSDGVIQFGLAKVTVPGSDVSKNLLVGWCPDNAPAKLRLSFAANFADVSKTLNGYHVQITARDLDDLNLDEFVSRIAAAAGARYTARAIEIDFKTDFKKQIPLTSSSGKDDSRPFIPKSTGKPVFHVPSNQSSKVRPSNSPNKEVEDDGWNGEKELEIRDFEKQPLELTPSAYKPTKVNIEELRKQKSDTVSSKSKLDVKSSTPVQAKVISSDADNEHALVDGRLTSLPKPKVAGSVASRYTAAAKESSNATFGSKPMGSPLPKRADKVISGMSRDFGSTGGKTPAQLWAEKKGMYKDVRSGRDSTSGEESGIAGLEDDSIQKHDSAVSIDDISSKLDQTFQKATGADALEEDLPVGARGIKEDDSTNAVHSSQPPRLPSRISPADATEEKKLIMAKASFDYDKDEDNEVDFKEDDVIVDIEFVDEEWWSGTNERTGELGLFPASYVTIINDGEMEKIGKVSSDEDTSSKTAKEAVAEFSYERDEDNEIEFEEGERIIDIEFVDDNWWSGKRAKTGEVGLFPANYVKLQN